MIKGKIVYNDSEKDFFPLLRAEGAFIWDRGGKRYIDFTSGWNVTNLGWNNPEITDAIISQAKKNAHGLLWGSDQVQDEYADALTASLPHELNTCVKATSGTESVEVAVKVARAYTGRKKLIGFEGLYHGQLFASLALGMREENLEKLSPLVPEIISVSLPPGEDVAVGEIEKFSDGLEKLLAREDVAALVIEPGMITGGSAFPFYSGAMKKVRELTEKYGTLLIFDEVGTGFSRTGRLFGMDHEGVVPDLAAFAKGISNGAAAMGAVVGKRMLFEKIAEEAVLISTFGWTPIACAAALQTLKIHIRDRIWERAERNGIFIREKLSKQIGEDISSVWGKGMEVGIQFRSSETCARVKKEVFAQGLHVVSASDDIFQLMPPLTIPQNILEEGLDIMVQSVQK